jgi:hypothetical protein
VLVHSCLSANPLFYPAGAVKVYLGGIPCAARGRAKPVVGKNLSGDGCRVRLFEACSLICRLAPIQAYGIIAK